MSGLTCKNCRFWNRALRAKWQDVTQGGGSVIIEHAQCRRYAPARVDDGRGNVPGRVWPHVNATDWCGDFQLEPTP